MTARKKKKPDGTTPHGVRCPPDMAKSIDEIRQKFGVDRSEVWRWGMTVALREFHAGRVTGPGEPGVPLKETAHV